MAQTKSMGYDSPVYQAVLQFPILHTSTTVNAGSFTSIAGASTLSTKFVAFTNMLIKSITSTATTVGTGVATAFTLGNVGTGNACAFVRITNNGTSHNGTCTGTYQMLGSYVLPAGGTALTTQATTVNWVPQTAYSTAIGTSAASVEAATSVNNWALINGGIPMKAGDIGSMVKGVDATEVILPWAVEAVVQPLANITP
jgi:hypothetical protein